MFCMVGSSMLKNVNGKWGIWSEISPLKSFNKSPGTNEGVKAMSRIVRQDLRAAATAKEGLLRPPTHTHEGTLRSPTWGFPCLSGGLYKKVGERGLNLQRYHGHTDSQSSSDTQPSSTRSPSCTRHFLAPHKGHIFCSKHSHVGLCSHPAH